MPQGFPEGELGMIITAVLAALTTSLILLFAFLIYMKYKKPGNGYKRMSPTSSAILLRQSHRDRIQSIFSTHGRPSVHSNGEAPDFDIPLMSRKNTGAPKSTCQLHFSLFYNFHLNEITIQVLQAQNLPKLFGLQSGVLVKVRLLEANGETREKVGKTSIHFRTNSVFNSVFTCKEITSAELQQLSVSLSLYSQDRFGQSHFVGGLVMKLSDVTFDPSEPSYFWRPVQRKTNGSSVKSKHEKGQLFVSLRYHEKTSRINVIVMKAVSLVKTKRQLRADPYVIVKLLKDGHVIEKKFTQPCKGSLDPVWNEPFVFDWKNGNSETSGYKFVFEIKSSDKVMPDSSMGVVEICQETSEHWKEMMDKKNYARAKCHDVT
ncbi:synaptotagmin-2-like isoform X2 [Dendronephthya gigantea]|uniref:synaptotagmin-2-like isoform X2 n=1 Tax=Dendronephthya gigantea TaxID=151771 RepID=UPI00106CDA5A|nr:synaptotagmin-2-like isoform X2 [Dendronephthya gigantea]